MRSLTKIVFINSAHIRYGEVALDGNVHFTGTQGVGKTTLLRALLFFYNARKDKLGIRNQGQRSFDDYYVPTPSSYIVYQVSRGEELPPFCAILFRHHNKAALRFVDAAYDRSWIIDDLGVVASDPLTIRQRIQNKDIDFSGIIDRYNQYLDILYGNRTARISKDLLKYYLLKSPQYQNIPRIIQNVFLNERVDAGFIKDTIISSISGDEVETAVDLNFFRSKLVNFSDELKDISLWTQKNKQGIVETRRDADKIIDIAHKISAGKFSIREQCGMLIYSRNKAERDLPILKSRIEKKQVAIDKLTNDIKSIESNFREAHERLSNEIAVIDSKLKDAARRKKEYQKIGIYEMIVRVESLPSLRLTLQQKQGLLAQLNAEYSSIAQKYSSLRDRLDIDFQQFRQKRTEEINKAKQEALDRKLARLEHRNNLENDVKEKFKTQKDEIELRLAEYRECRHELELSRLEASKSSPLKDELEVCRSNLSKLEKDENSLKEEKFRKESALESNRIQMEMECQRLENEYATQISSLENQINSLTEKLNSERSLLERSQGSFCEWLDRNVEDWVSSIGKIADEKEVLYRQSLNPKLVHGNQSDTLFGVKIDLDEIEKEVRTPAMINEDVKVIETKINTLANEINRLRDEKDNRISENGKKRLSAAKSLQADIDAITQKIQVCQQQSRKENLRLADTENDVKARLYEIDAAFRDKIQKLTLEIDSNVEVLKKIDDHCKRELNAISKNAKDEDKNDKNLLETQVKSVEDDIMQFKNETDSKIRQLDKDERVELSNAGADTVMIERLNNEINETERRIHIIEKEQDKVAIYRNVCETLLDHVPQYQTDKKRLEDKDASLRQTYDRRKQTYESNRKDELIALSELQSTLDKTSESISRADDFMASDSFPPELKESQQIPTELDCITLVESIKELTGKIYRLTDSLKSSVNDFKRRFSQCNTFKFPTELETTAHYCNYADKLEEFVTNDMIKEFQQVTSNMYRDILSRAAADFNVLLGRESEIQRIVKDINYDFSRKTFAGVIRSIELRLERSTMPIIMQLQNITEFWNTHQYNIGELNLFSGEEHEDISRDSIKYLKSLSEALTQTPELSKLPLEQTFTLKFKIEENDNSTGWTENIKAVGSEGTDTLVKAIMNILLISVFKKRAGQAGDFRLHCMMDEIGRLADENIQGILNFANERDIYIVNSSPKSHKPLSYRRLYLLSKDKDANTIVQPILSTREAELL
ncbi:MAG: ATP-binding protein [Bacteroidales bacterium]|nr:ATP-binding protein [Bacteroidales bacterium]